MTGHPGPRREPGAALHGEGMVRFISVSGPEDPALEVYSKLSEVQLKRLYEPDGGLFIAESAKVVARALSAGCVPVSMLVEDRHVTGEAADVIAECGRLKEDIPVYTGRYEDLVKLTGYALTRGVLCAMRRPPLRTVGEVLDRAEAARAAGAAGAQARETGDMIPKAAVGAVPAKPAGAVPEKVPGTVQEEASEEVPEEPAGAVRIAVLENVMNPANVGSIFRNAAALGMDAVLLTDGCSDPLYRRTLRVSMGTTLQIPWAWIGRSMDDWKSKGLEMLKKRGYRTIAMALREDAVEIRQLRLGPKEKAAVILGAEGDGLLPETIAGADSVTIIPMMRGVDSLNVAAASAVAFFEIGKR